MYVISKIIGIFSQIFGILLLILFWASFRAKIKSILLLTSCLYLISSGLLISLILDQYEYPIRPLELEIPTKYPAVVLGGVLYQNQADTSRICSGPQADRFFHAIQLYMQGKCSKVIFSGGDAGIITHRTPEAILAKRYWKLLKLDTTDFFAESQSRNTRENAQFTAKIVRQWAHSDTLIVCTSAWHLPRAMLYFQKQGLHPIPYATDAMHSALEPPYVHLLLPSGENIIKWQRLLHEWLGIIAALYIE